MYDIYLTSTPPATQQTAPDQTSPDHATHAKFPTQPQNQSSPLPASVNNLRQAADQVFAVFEIEDTSFRCHLQPDNQPCFDKRMY